MSKMKSYLEEEIKKINKIDIITLIIILLIYTIISFNKLGDKVSINTFYKANDNEEITLKLDKEETINKIKFYTGNTNAKFDMLVKEGDDYTAFENQGGTGAFTWNVIDMLNTTDEIKLVFKYESSLGEVALYNSSNKLIPYKIDKIKELNDEEKYIVDHPSYMNSTYFDEVYFARTAYEYVYGLNLYEWTHPPLGKIIQAIPIYITHKMTPFNYRLMSNISGILIVGIMYIFGAIYFKKRKYAILSSVIMSLDTLHFVHTRMGTVDPHLVLFIMLANLVMILFVKKEKIIYLFTSGIFFALSISVKWTGFYGGLALAIIYFVYMIKTKQLNIKYVTYGIYFFVIIPVIIYTIPFYIFPNNFYKTDNIKNIVLENQQMYKYHSGVTEEHFFSSPWYTWPISYKPVWLHVQQIDGETKETISNVGNIVLWYAAIIGLIATLIIAIKKRNENSIYLVVSTLCMWLPYMFIGRIMFLYHYYPVLPFIFLALVNAIKNIEEKTKFKLISPILVIIALIFFIRYYPVISGKEADINHVEKLKLYETWYF